MELIIFLNAKLLAEFTNGIQLFTKKQPEARSEVSLKKIKPKGNQFEKYV